MNLSNVSLVNESFKDKYNGVISGSSVGEGRRVVDEGPVPVIQTLIVISVVFTAVRMWRNRGEDGFVEAYLDMSVLLGQLFLYKLLFLGGEAVFGP